MNRSRCFLLACLLIATAGTCLAQTQTRLGPYITVQHGPVNGAIVEKDGNSLAVYGEPAEFLYSTDMVLFTHFRRDVVWSARHLVENDTISVAPSAEIDNFTKVEAFWSDFSTKRFHDYYQQTTKIPTTSLRVDKQVSGGDTLDWHGTPIEVLDTPGYTRGSVSYFINIDGKKYGFVGDLIYGQGQLFDLYSLQDAVPQARIGGYHGYAGRLGDLVQSLRKVLAQKPDILIPARGPVIRNPDAAIELLLERVQAAYANYLSINAGHWYFKERYDTLAERVLGSPDRVDWMPYARTINDAPPDWIIPINNSRLILSEDGAAFLVDCGSSSIVNKVVELKNSGKFSSLDGLFITHYHDDHTDKVNELLDKFDCPVYATPVLEDVLQNPHAYRLPCLTLHQTRNLTIVPHAHKMRWKEFTLTFYDFPGQTIYHDAMLVERDDSEKIFFIGDSFTPSGIDDYCLQNRCLIHDGMGYLYCLNMLKKMPPDTLLINEHVVQPFAYDKAQIAHMIDTLTKRKEILRNLFPWDEPNYGIDERWARIYPYGQTAKPGESVEIGVRILNHSDKPKTYKITPNTPETLRLEPATISLTVGSRQQHDARFRVTLPLNIKPGVHVITADVEFDNWRLRHWCEAIVEIAP